MRSSVYITSAGKYLPGKPVFNDEIEEYLGKIGGRVSRTKEKILKQNGILTRYYAIDKNQQTTISNSQMTVNAIEDCIQNSTIHKTEIDFLAAATTQGDLPIPGFASMVHAQSGIGECEIATLHGVCGSSMMAIKNAYMQVKSEGKKNAIACAGEMPSRMFKAQHFEKQTAQLNGKDINLETDFLRWMLSDGAGALLLQSQPNPNKFSLQIEWIDLKSHAHLFDACMYTGANKDKQGKMGKSWLDYSNFQEADADGAVNLKQDIKLVNNIVKLGVDGFFDLINENKISGNDIDYLVCHYSSHYFKGEILKLMEKSGFVVPEEKWFTNLYTKGNTGAASIFIMLEELLNSGKLKSGQKILCMVPESGRFITSFMYLTVVAPGSINKKFTIEKRVIEAPKIHASIDNETQQWLVRSLTQIWIDFENKLNKVPIIDKINRGNLSLEEYRNFLVNLHQQIIDRSQWLAKATSNLSADFFEVRSLFNVHTGEENLNYKMLEKNFVSIGGKLEEIRNGEKNIGNEALTAFMFQRAGQPNPFDLLGAMFIIEGLDNRMAGIWGKAIRDQLNLEDDQVSFLLHHEMSDAHSSHFDRFEKAIRFELLTKDTAKQIVKTSKVVARLYLLQLEELGNF